MKPIQDNLKTDDSTQLEQVVKLSDKLSATINKVLRDQENGLESNVELARANARALFDQIIAALPAERKEQQAIFSPLDLMASYWTRQAERRAMAATGFSALNKALSGGLERDRLYVLLGAPGSGKTTLANQIGDSVAYDRPVFYVSSEDTPLTLLSKTIARRSTIEYSAVLRGYPSEKDRIDAAFRDYSEQPQSRNIKYLDATLGTNLAAIAEQAYLHFEKRKAETKGDGLIVIDYLQRLARAEDMHIRAAGGSLGADARQAATVYTERLRALACDLHCSVLCLSAMNRASGYHAGNSVIASAKESGDIDYTADVIMALGEKLIDGEPEVLSDPTARAWMLRIDKNRQGMNTYSGGHINLTWFPILQRFVEREEDQEAPATAEPEPAGRSRYSRRRG